MRGRGRGRGSVPSRAMQAVRNLERRMTWHRTVPANNPPSFVERPWNSWTFERLDTTTTDLQLLIILVSDIVLQIRGKCSIAETANILIKVQSSQIWCTASTLIVPDISVNFYELSGESSSSVQNSRSSQRDKGTLNMPAKTGYVYPSADRKDILGTPQANLTVCDATPSANGSNVTFRIQVLWQSTP